MEHSLSESLYIFPRRFKEIPRILRNPELHYPVHISPPLMPTLSHINPVYAHTKDVNNVYF